MFRTPLTALAAVLCLALGSPGDANANDPELWLQAECRDAELHMGTADATSFDQYSTGLRNNGVALEGALRACRTDPRGIPFTIDCTSSGLVCSCDTLPGDWIGCDWFAPLCKNTGGTIDRDGFCVWPLPGNGRDCGNPEPVC